MKLFEYMSAGKAIISSDLPSIREILHHEIDAILVTPCDVDGWVKALQRLQNPELRNQLGSAARAQLEASFTWLQRAEDVLGGLSLQHEVP